MKQLYKWLSFGAASWQIMAGQPASAQSTFQDASSYATGIGSASSDAGTSLATGTIAPSLPLLALPGVALSVPIGLSYTAGAGVKVNDVASEVGLGWVLTGGGAITREIKGRPDDVGDYGWFVDKYIGSNGELDISTSVRTPGQVVSYFRQYNTSTSILSWLYPASQIASYGQYNFNNSSFSPSQRAQNETYSSYYSRWAGKAFIDTEPDVFTISLPTGRLQFVFDPVGNPIPLQAQNIQIAVLNLGNRLPTTSGLLHEFIVTTSDGTKYYFGSQAGDATYKETAAFSTKVLELPGQASKEDITCIYKWLLKKIVAPTGETVNYEYSGGSSYFLTTNNYVQQNYVYTTSGGQNLSGNFDNPYQGDPIYYSGYGQPSAGFYNWERHYTIQSNLVSSDAKQLLSITNSLGKLLFTYQSGARLDVGGATRALSSIQLQDSRGTLIKRLDIQQHYADFGYSLPNTSSSDRYHLLLDRIIDRGAGCDYTKLLEFGYNSQVFSRNAVTKDDWGYLNSLQYPSNYTWVGAFSAGAPRTHTFSLTGRARTPDATLAQALILTSITAATGGVQSFTYELHDCYPIGQTNQAGVSNSPVGGLRIKRVTKYDGLDHANDIIDEYSYRKKTNVNESSGCWGDPGLYAKLQMIHGFYFPRGPWTNKPKQGFMRLNEAEIRGAIPGCIDNADPGTSSQWYDYFYLMRSDASFYQYAADYIDYSCVTVTHGQKGKTRYEFTSWADADRRDYVDQNTVQRALDLTGICPNDPLNPSRRSTFVALPVNNPNQLDGVSMGYADGITASFPNRSSRAAERGLPLVVTELTNNDVPVAATSNQYDFTHPAVSLPVINAVVVKPDMEVFGFSQYSRYFQLYYYNVASQWCPLTQTTSIIYGQNANGTIAQAQATITKLEYNNFFPRKITKYTATCTSPTSCSQLTGAPTYVTELRRAQDFDNGANTGNPDQVTTAGLLRTAGMTATVIEQVESLVQPSGSITYKSAALAEYQLINNRVLPTQTYSIPVGMTSFTPATTGQVNGSWSFTKDSNYQLTSSINGYTEYGQAINMLDRGGVNKAVIWGYNHTLPIATITNGQAVTGPSGDGLISSTAHTSFEEDGTNGLDGDGWGIPTVFSTTEAKTGIRSARIVVNQSQYGPGRKLTLTAGANRHGKLVFSFWAKLPQGKTNATPILPVIAGQGNNNGWDGNGSTTIQSNQNWQYVQTIIDLDNATWNNGLAASDNLQLIVYPWCPYGDEVLVDEVRVHRADALMQTTTYTPLVGKTSTTDPSGVTSYYVYDSNNQPRLTLNQNRDIVQRTQSRLLNQSARPVATFTAPEVTMQNCTVQLVADYNNCGNTTFTWDFGDGQKAINSIGRQGHDYSQPGTYTISLLVADSQRGAARYSKTVTVNEPYHTDIDIVGSTSVDFCTNQNPEPVIMTANVQAGDCQGLINYQWQVQNSYGGGWTNVASTPTISCQVQLGTQNYRCVIVTRYGSNASSPSLQVIPITGYRSSNCDQIQQTQ